MTIKSILCIFGGSQCELNAVNTALVIGKINNAHISFLHISPNPSSYAGVYGEDVIAATTILEAIEKENEVRMQKARQHVVSLTAQHNIPLDAPELLVRHASAKFVHLTGYFEDIIAREGRLNDLVIIGRGAYTQNTLYDAAVVSALFSTGRPVLLIPVAKGAMANDWKDKTIAVAWKGTKEASQAIYNAMPFLEKAEKVYVLTVEGNGEVYDLEAEAAMVQYLRMHGINGQSIAVAAGNRTPAEALLMRAKELDADFLVMGAYGRSRFREMLLGGVTNYMLEKADIPLLMSH